MQNRAGDEEGGFLRCLCRRCRWQPYPWMDGSRPDEDEMRDLMRQVVSRLYTF